MDEVWIQLNYILYFISNECRMSLVSFPGVIADVVVVVFAGLFSVPFKFVLGMHDRNLCCWQH